MFISKTAYFRVELQVCLKKDVKCCLKFDIYSN